MNSSSDSLGEDLRLEVSLPSGKAGAWLWWTHVPPFPGERLGVIGRFHADHPVAAKELLRQACEELRARGCGLAVGPMDGNTWRSYRFVTEPGTEPAFLLEPANPPEWPAWWAEAGFSTLAEYESTGTTDLSTQDPRLASVSERMARNGVTIRPLKQSEFEAELVRIHGVSLVSFRENFLYTPLPLELFSAQYQAVRALVVPELVLLAEQAGKTVGFVFAFPNHAQARRGEPVTEVVVKTLAVLPGRDFAGLGALLFGEVHAAARRLGFRRAIHALMHRGNRSRNLTARYGESIRRYALFSLRLEEPRK